ncbi:MAG: nucleoside 2-deoxyribosyltransferase [Candidatus Saccharimonadales bacterium]
MKVYITSRFQGADNKHEIQALCSAVKEAGMTDFSFIRDIEHYKHTFDNPKDLWQRSYDEIGACDALLIDVSDNPTGGRLVEVGIAYALRKPVIIVKRPSVDYKPLFDGISSVVIEYHDYKDLTSKLKQYELDRNFNVTDKSAMLMMFLLLGGVIGWTLAQYFIPLAYVGMVVYWLLMRKLFEPLRAFDRIIILIPLAILWLAGLFYLKSFYIALMVAWGIGFWIITLYILRKLKLAL